MGDKNTGSDRDRAQSPGDSGDVQPNARVEEFFSKLQQDLRWPKPSEEAIAAARSAIGQLECQAVARDPGAERDDDSSMETIQTRRCPACGVAVPSSFAFCGSCGAPVDKASPAQGIAGAGAQHHYHHHYHHHYLEGKGEAGIAAALSGVPGVRSDAARPTVVVPGVAASLSRTEANLRKLVQEWVAACNTRHLDNLLDCYAPDALVLRTNHPAIRGAAAIREFFFAALDAGLSDMELEPIRTVAIGDMAYEAGRCKMLAPVAVGKRREERGKYVLVFSRQPNGEWKIMTDSWNSDLALKPGEMTAPAASLNPQVAKMPRRP
jgi:uncharacterized protein (TIGR02246 family)